MLRFGELFSKSWSEYKLNFKLFFQLFLWFSLVPTIIFSAIVIFFFNEGLSSYSVVTLFSTFLPLFILIGLITVILSVFMTLAMIYTAFYPKNKLKLGQAFKGGLAYFWRYIGLAIVLIFFLAVLFLLLIIPGIIFMVYWVFAFYILVRENTGIWESMKRSKAVVKGRWWKVFGFSLLMIIIVSLISFVFSIPEIILGLVSAALSTALSTAGSAVLLESPWGVYLAGIVKAFGTLIATPLMILFFKNFYLDLRANMGKKN